MEEVLEDSYAIKCDLYKGLCCLLRCKWRKNSRQLLPLTSDLLFLPICKHLKDSAITLNFITVNRLWQWKSIVKHGKSTSRLNHFSRHGLSRMTPSLCNELETARPRCLSITAGAAIIQVRSDSGIAFWRKTQFILESQTLVSSVMLKRANERFLYVCKTSRHQPTLKPGSNPQADLKDARLTLSSLNTGKMFWDLLQFWHQRR